MHFAALNDRPFVQRFSKTHSKHSAVFLHAHGIDLIESRSRELSMETGSGLRDKRHSLK